MTGNKQVKKGKKSLNHEVVDIDYSIVQDMNKAITKNSFLDISKIISQQELIMKVWKEDIECTHEEKCDVLVNLV